MVWVFYAVEKVLSADHGPAYGNSRVRVTCGTCNGSGRAKALNGLLQFVEDVCPICCGQGTLTVPRKPIAKAAS